MPRLINTSFILLISIWAGWTQAADDVQITISNIKNTQGQLIVELFDGEKTFLEKPAARKIIPIDASLKAQIVFSDIKPGVYAATAIHDANANSKVDTNFIGIPKEDIAFSNGAVPNRGAPKFKDAKVTVDDAHRVIELKFISSK
ncbi:MAG: DUF2141 domain-containing protein [Gammaproteobacteria bacterium]|nr:DUF2141 domain-containing protein [Gammaproteobacteria bacterium]